MDQILYEAARIMDEHGRAVGSGIDAQGQVCLSGALCAGIKGYDHLWHKGRLTAEDMLLYNDRMAKLWRVLFDSTPHPDQHEMAWRIIRWNDELGRTKEECVKALMEAAERE